MLKKDRILNCIFSVMALLALWLAWLVAALSVGNELVVPSVGETFAEIGRLLRETAFWGAFGGTLLRSLEAFFISLALGVGLGLLAALFRPARAFFAPIVSVLRTVPTMAVVLILLLWTSPAAAPVIIATLVLFPVFYAAILSAIDGVREEYGEVASAFHVPKIRQAFCMYLPLSAPPVLSQMGATFSLGLKITVSGEVLSATAKSLGSMMQQAQGYLQTPRLIALTVLAVVVGFVFEGLFALGTYFLRRRDHEVK